jgi:hypothetical protein
MYLNDIEVIYMLIFKQSVVGFNQNTLIELMAEWVVATDQAHITVENAEFRTLVEYLNPQAHVPSGDTIRREINALYEGLYFVIYYLIYSTDANMMIYCFNIAKQTELKEYLATNTSKLSFMQDTWSSKDMTPFMAVTAHWISEDWELCQTLLLFDFLPCPHTGENIAIAFLKGLQHFELQEKVSII